MGNLDTIELGSTGSLNFEADVNRRRNFNEDIFHTKGGLKLSFAQIACLALNETGHQLLQGKVFWNAEVSDVNTHVPGKLLGQPPGLLYVNQSWSDGDCLTYDTATHDQRLLWSKAEHSLSATDHVIPIIVSETSCSGDDVIQLWSKYHKDLLSNATSPRAILLYSHNEELSQPQDVGWSLSRTPHLSTWASWTAFRGQSQNTIKGPEVSTWLRGCQEADNLEVVRCLGHMWGGKREKQPDVHRIFYRDFRDDLSLPPKEVEVGIDLSQSLDCV